jgi:hypothetical protein
MLRNLCLLLPLAACASSGQDSATDALTLGSGSGGLDLLLDADGATVVSDEATVHLRTVAWGADGALIPLGAGLSLAEEAAGLATLRHAGMTERWEAVGEDLEQSWLLDADPTPGDGRVVIEVQVEGATPLLRADGDGLLLLGHAGASFGYDQLHVTDADGAVLPADMGVEGDRIRITVETTGATWPVLVDPVVSTATDVFTGANYMFYGSAVSGAGDVNGDGYLDIIVGAQAHWSCRSNGNNRGPGYGRAYLLYGSATGPSTSGMTTLVSPSDADCFGAAVYGVGDVNGDGYSDVAVGAPDSDSDTGSVYVYHGGTPKLSTTYTTKISGLLYSSTTGNFGQNIKGGDITGDGYSDIVVGAEDYNSYTGKVFLFKGSSGTGATGGITTTGYKTIGTGSSTGMRFGEDFDVLDVNLDGKDDVCVGELSYNSNKGRVRCYRSIGASGFAAPTYLTNTSTSIWFGGEVELLPDATGDGCPDMAVSHSNGAGTVGSVSLYKGNCSFGWTLVNTVTDSATNSEFGIQIAEAGDTNADNLTDLIIGARLGGTGGKAYVYDGLGAGLTLATTLTGPVTSGHYGAALGSVRDFGGNCWFGGCGEIEPTLGNGTDDILVGAPSTTVGGYGSAGTVYVNEGY